jgi:hypothetical protein
MAPATITTSFATTAKTRPGKSRAREHGARPWQHPHAPAYRRRARKSAARVGKETLQGVYDFVARRFDASTDTWSDPAIIAGATMKNTELSQGLGIFALGGNASGLAALSFSDWDSTADSPPRLELASFY